MKDKLLVNVFVPSLNETFEIFLPYNETIHIIVKDLLKICFELSDGRFDITKNYYLLNRNTGIIYSRNAVLINTDIRSGTDLLLF